MHEMWTTATSVLMLWCVCQSVMGLHPAKTAAWINILFGMKTLGGPRNIVLGGWRCGVMVNNVALLNQHWAQWVLGWVIVFGWVYHLANWVDSAFHPSGLGSVKWGPALAGNAKAWFIPFADKHVGDSNTVRSLQRVPYLSASVMRLSHKEALYQVSLTFTFKDLLP